MADILLVGDAVSPVVDSESAVCAAALARALAAADHQVTILSIASEERAAHLPGMARRLRTVLARLADGDREFPMFEGRSAVSQCALHVIGSEAIDRGHSAAFLANAASALVHDEICKPDAIIAWGETAAAVLPAVPASTRLFVLPAGTWAAPLSTDERAALDPNAPDLAMAKGSLTGLGAIDADVVVFPSPSSAKAFAEASEFSFRASDQAVVAIRLGCDEAPHDPAVDPALTTSYSESAIAGKSECRRTLARRVSLALGPRTLLLTTAPLVEAEGGRRLLEALSQLIRSDVAVVVPGDGDRLLLDEVRRLAIAAPGKVAVHPDASASAARQMLAGADAMLLSDRDALHARSAGIAMRYGVLPLAPDTFAYHDFVVDFDVASQTGNGMLYQPTNAYEHVSTVLRAAQLRGNPDLWQPLQCRLMHTAPRWLTAATQFEGLCASLPASA
jgi:hypothetical protein